MGFIPADSLVIDRPVTTTPAPRRPFLTIRPAKGWVALNLGELWQFRDLMFALASRDIKLRYKQTALGVVWVVLQPLMSAAIFTFVFGTVAHMQSGPIPYFALTYAAMMGWNLFNSVLTKGGNSLVGNTNLVSKVYFPRLILPLSALPSSMVDFGIAVVMLVVIMLMFHVPLLATLVIGGVHMPPGTGLLLVPIWLVLLLMYAIGIGLFATSLMVTYRDVAYMLPMALQILFFACPLTYQAWQVPKKVAMWYNLNPLSSIFQAITWSIFGTVAPSWQRLLYGAVAGLIVLFAGLFAFKRMEKKFADVI